MGTSKAQFVNGRTVQVLNGVGYLVLDPSASAAASASASAPVSNTVVNRVYQALAIAISISIEQNDTMEPPIIPLPPQPNDTVDPTPGPPIDNSTEREPLPYCDLVAADYTGSCHDRKDFDDVTGLYPCNDGT